VPYHLQIFYRKSLRDSRTQHVILVLDFFPYEREDSYTMVLSPKEITLLSTIATSASKVTILALWFAGVSSGLTRRR
jgi:hypothetical protein